MARYQVSKAVAAVLLVASALAAGCGDDGGGTDSGVPPGDTDVGTHGDTDASAGEDAGGALAGDPSAGEAAVQTRACATCHTGEAGLLAGQDALGANITPDAQTGIGAWSDDALVLAILSGAGADGEELCITMPRYATLGMGETEARDIVAYLRSIPAISNEPAEACQ